MRPKYGIAYGGVSLFMFSLVSPALTETAIRDNVEKPERS
jgi:hypothetical protein